MRLLYLWVDDSEKFADFGVNFTDGYRFKTIRDGDVYCVDCEKREDAVPEEFFAIRGAKVQHASAIVGDNSSGKTSIARFIQHIRANPDATSSFNYVLVYEIGDVWGVQWCVRRTREVDEFLDVDFRGELFENKNSGGKLRKCKAGTGLQKNQALWDFEFVYYTPHFTTENPFPANSPEMENLSTYGVMYGGFEEQMNRPYTIHDHEGIQRNYIAAEHRRGLTALRKIPRAPEGIDLPEPKNVVIGIHTVEFDENVRWLKLQKSRLQGQIEAWADKKPGMADWARRKIQDIAVFEEVVEYCSSSTHERRDFVLRCFAAFLLTNVRISGFFETKFDPLYVEYACRLGEIYLTTLKPFIEGSVGADVKLVYGNLVKELESSVILHPTPRPGNIVEEAYPECLNERKAVIEVFKKLSEWSLINGAPYQGIEELSIPVDQSDEIGRFYDSYLGAMNRFDFLSFRYDPVLSSGEMCFLSLYGRLLDFFERNEWSRRLRAAAKKKEEQAELPSRFFARSFSPHMVIILDEAETTFHPKWQRDIVLNVLKFVNSLNCEIDAHLIFATHSPMILSDIPIGNVVFLRDCKVVHFDKDQVSLSETFCANVYDLYRLGFFMDGGSVGAFARERITDVASCRIDSQDPVARYVANHIGDALLARCLRRSLGRKKNWRSATCYDKTEIK